MSMALKYGMQKRAKKAAGGECPGPECEGCSSPQCMAEGGEVKGVHRDTGLTRLTDARDPNKPHFKETGESKAGERLSYGDKHGAKKEHKRVLGEMHSMRDKDRKYLAEGGEVTDDDDDLVGRIMRKRKGEPAADFESNDFDVLDEDPAPDDADYTGANSGDELGNAELDENDRDLISRIMRSRAKRDRMPRPA